MNSALDLCAGAGGLSLGLQRAGFDVLGIEGDDTNEKTWSFSADACETHRANVGPCLHASIRDWSPEREYDLAAGGVPCTDHSNAGKRMGVYGHTGALFHQLIRIGVESSAKSLLIENVVGMKSTRDKEGWATIARVEDEMKRNGYEPRHCVLCAADYGVPQLRYRLFIVAFKDPSHLARFRWPAPTHAEPPNLFGLPPWITVREALGLGEEKYQKGRREGANGWNGERYVNVDEPSTTVVESNGNADMLKRETEKLSYIPATTSVPDRPSHTSERLSSALQPFDHRPSTTISNDPRLPAAGHHASQQTNATRLSLAHRAILQGFPPDFVFHGKTQASKDKQVGNAVPYRLAEAVGRSIRDAIK